MEKSEELGYEFTELPGRGMGVVATKDFAVGDCIISEKPLFTCDISHDNEKRLNSEIKSHLNELKSGSEKEAFFSLSDCHEGEKTPIGIFKTNAHPCGFKDTAKRSGILPIICRINHSCCPNAQHSWNEKK
eukprot:Pgem_evm1s8069